MSFSCLDPTGKEQPELQRVQSGPLCVRRVRRFFYHQARRLCEVDLQQEGAPPLWRVLGKIVVEEGKGLAVPVVRRVNGS
jgi:hypothetical protein